MRPREKWIFVDRDRGLYTWVQVDPLGREQTAWGMCKCTVDNFWNRGPGPVAMIVAR